MAQPAPITRPATTTAIRSYRIYFRDGANHFATPHDVDLGSDDDARQLAILMLDGQANYPCIEVWEGARLVCDVRRGEQERSHPTEPTPHARLPHKLGSALVHRALRRRHRRQP